MTSFMAVEPPTAGRVTLHTTVGDISVELWSGKKEAPLACRNFVQLCLEGYYDGHIFHRIVKDFIAQTGDPTGTGQGGESIFDEPFADEFSPRLRFNRRGLVGMANPGTRDTNLSQFFVTMDKADELTGKHTLFGRLYGDTLYNVLRLNELELEEGTERPVYPPRIRSVTVDDNPFDDIVPRITASERREQEKARLASRQSKKGSNRKGTKNAGLLSFEEEAQPAAAPRGPKTLSAHDVLDDKRLSSRIVDDRAMHIPQLPDTDTSRPVKRKIASPVPEPVQPKRAAPKPKEPSPDASAKVQAQIEKVQAEMRRMKDRKADQAAEAARAQTKAKASLLAAEREKYAHKRKIGKKLEDRALGASLNDFDQLLRTKVKEVKQQQPAADSHTNPEDNLEEDVDETDLTWLGHTLKFRKDATLDRSLKAEYEAVDPLNRKGITLEEAQQEATRQARIKQREAGPRKA
ncbi:uncharacterized protein L969DRAFT_322806 [Mixia osmundae IAM 14324]|uniref:PPIase cyclophilin-type domain-containing protein n=1 Tax=Mixia osmundae (strain CBS 9802 / IAM 14324 / JCM 22182 / KY 12970) TaxID=764103 RepID=G7DTR9_MIXOS|nr:uncharacterized protein L969DRAFT_322806 [Mixia osmundae IAM 14324]KEI41695.1 hypothetical protein L969DRAFT_322806 [Mixia osmundae IAM 14324]GAA93979.1 hypothetical protein E5Q_00626 [Mixia osmundae IAM 14324]